MGNCVFCGIVRLELPATVVHESAHFICFLPLEQEAPGHTIIASKGHYESLLDAAPDIGNDFVAVCQHLARVHRASSGALGFNILNANGSAAQQSVMHLHFHFVPRHSGDDINAWPAFGGASGKHSG